MRWHDKGLGSNPKPSFEEDGFEDVEDEDDEIDESDSFDKL